MTIDWDDPRWLVKSDTAWRSRLRRHQGWWRATQTGHGPGPLSNNDDRLVVSMLPRLESLAPNLMTPEARTAAEDAIARLQRKEGPGMIQRDRLERNLLSSQPMCFNLFGYFREQPAGLLPWVQSLRPNASEITCVELEIAPAETPLGGSAFDAYVEYSLDGRERGFLGIECKYAETLGYPRRAPEKYREATTSPPWLTDATDELDRPRLRQFWYNTLLCQLTECEGGFVEGMSVVVAMEQDEPARAATEDVRSQLIDPTTMGFSSLQDVVALVDAPEDWKTAMTTRYLNLTLSG